MLAKEGGMGKHNRVGGTWKKAGWLEPGVPGGWHV